jgi:hypothetical protein
MCLFFDSGFMKITLTRKSADLFSFMETKSALRIFDSKEQLLSRRFADLPDAGLCAHGAALHFFYLDLLPGQPFKDLEQHSGGLVTNGLVGQLSRANRASPYNIRK